MNNALVDALELKQMRENVRRSVDSLELCWSCQRICECEHGLVDDGAPVWLCKECLSRLQFRRQEATETMLWPSI